MRLLRYENMNMKMKCQYRGCLYRDAYAYPSASNTSKNLGKPGAPPDDYCPAVITTAEESMRANMDHRRSINEASIYKRRKKRR